LEALSDGVLAIIITIMVLELKVPDGHDLSDLARTAGFGLLTYLVSPDPGRRLRPQPADRGGGVRHSAKRDHPRAGN
jgi:hypothetical protein